MLAFRANKSPNRLWKCFLLICLPTQSAVKCSFANAECRVNNVSGMWVLVLSIEISFATAWTKCTNVIFWERMLFTTARTKLSGLRQKNPTLSPRWMKHFSVKRQSILRVFLKAWFADVRTVAWIVRWLFTIICCYLTELWQIVTENEVICHHQTLHFMNV